MSITTVVRHITRMLAIFLLFYCYIRLKDCSAERDQLATAKFLVVIYYIASDWSKLQPQFLIFSLIDVKEFKSYPSII